MVAPGVDNKVFIPFGQPLVPIPSGLDCLAIINKYSPFELALCPSCSWRFIPMNKFQSYEYLAALGDSLDERGLRGLEE